jgi:hypothetical protein
MATTTPNYGWDVPTSTDYVKDGATAIETLGDDIDASLFSITSGKNVGLVHINTTTISAAASTTISNVFTSAFNDYLITWQGNTSAPGGAQYIFFNLSSSGTPASNTNWVQLLTFSQDSTGPGRASNAGTEPYRFGYTGNNWSTVDAIVKNPQSAVKTLIQSTSFERSSVDVGVTTGGGLYNVTTSYDGCVITTSGGGNLTGTIRIYGLRNS